MLVSALILGLLGSLHCVGMCGPIAFILPLHRDSPTKKIIQLFTYHFGRLLSYATLGLFFGIIGKGFFISGLQQNLSIVIGILMIIIVLIPYKYFQKYNFSKPVFKLLSKVKSALGARLKNKSYSSLFSIGILNGLLPCGLIYMALFGAIAMGSPGKSSIYMLLFGLGTIPLMSVTVYLGDFLSTIIKERVQQLKPILILVIGLFFILRGLGLGIPYISPSNINLIVKSTPDCVVPY